MSGPDPHSAVPERILILTADYPPIEGGISTVCTQFARQLAARGYRVTVLAPRFPSMDAFDEAEPVDVMRFPGYHLGWLRLFPMTLWALPLLLRHDAIVAINISHGGLIALAARLLFGKPYLTFAYAYEFLRFKRTPIIGALLRAAYNRSAVTVAISAFTRDNLAAFGVCPARIATALPGALPIEPVSNDEIDRVRHHYTIDAAPFIFSVGRLIDRKNHVALVRALPAILAAVPDAVLLIAGRGPCVSAISRAANELAVRDHVVLPGYVPDGDLHALYAACDVFALPAGEGEGGHVEGFGLVFTEAHAHGKAVVGGRSGGVVDAVHDGETGILVDPGDDDALARAVIALLTDKQRARTMGDAGRDRVTKELNWEAFTGTALDAARWGRG